MAISQQAATVGGSNAYVEKFRAWRLGRNDSGYSGAVRPVYGAGLMVGECAVDWYTSEEFELGKLYADADGRCCLEFAGVTTARAARLLPGVRDQVIETGDELERVLTFIVKGSRGPITFYTHTKADADVGYWFISYADAVPLAPATLVEDPRSA